ncbi:MAG: DUF1697 domain-containing protein [Actinomycetota bacterium]|nr:DUF1697 domain-containing protein [Actinomycetota bacterium]
MPVHVAFLRAINVGNRRVSKDRLREPFEKLGFAEVSTFIASGNVIFSTSEKPAAVEPAVEAALTEALGFEVVAFVRPASAVARVVRDQPFSGSEDSVHVGFLKKPVSPSVRSALDELGNDVDSVTAEGREVYWLARGGMGRATVSGSLLEKTLGQPTTLRSLKMLTRLLAKLG